MEVLMRRLLMGFAVTSLVMLCPKYEARTASELPTSPRIDPSLVPVPTGEVGVASWYGEEFQGSETASGEMFDQDGLTAAHRKLPLGTKIKVTNLRNSRSAVLRVNDRGPNVRGRLLDVSYAAAQRLGFEATGAVKVRIKIMSFPKGYVAPSVKASELTTRCVSPAS
jgi:rare lipoprotein A